MSVSSTELNNSDNVGFPFLEFYFTFLGTQKGEKHVLGLWIPSPKHNQRLAQLFLSLFKNLVYTSLSLSVSLVSGY